MLRRLLGERARDHSYILSVSGSGYRFALPVVEALREATAPIDEATPEEALLHSGVEPFRNYCQGSFFLEQRTAPAIRRAIECFEAALAADSNYLPALIGFARAHSLLAVYWHVSPSLSYPLAKQAIAQALKVDPNCSIAHAVYSGILCFCDWDWKRAQDEIDLAIRLNPGSTFVRNNAAWLYVCAGRYEDALVQAQSALTMEPASLPLQLLVARVLVHSREYPKAIALMSNLLEHGSGILHRTALSCSSVSSRWRSREGAAAIWSCCHKSARRIRVFACRCSAARAPISAIGSARARISTRCDRSHGPSTSSRGISR